MSDFPSQPMSETDIVLRLRHLAKLLGVGSFDIPARLNEAADEIERLRGLSQEPATFYGAQCPTYPNCSGGCGLGCTHEIEQARAARSSPETESAARSIAEIIDPVAFDPISLKDSHPSWRCRRESAIETANKILAIPQGAVPPLRMCGLCGTWNSKPCGNQCGLQITDPTYEQMAFANAAEAAGHAPRLPERVPVKLTESAHRLWMCINGHDINDFYERAEFIINTSLDGLQVGPGNRASVKALLVEHFEQIAKAALTDTSTDRGTQ